jgi:hypothetical protein
MSWGAKVHYLVPILVITKCNTSSLNGLWKLCISNFMVDPRRPNHFLILDNKMEQGQPYKLPFHSLSMADDNDHQLTESIWNQSAIVVTDAAFKEEYGATAWIMCCFSSSATMKGQTITPGTPSDRSPYRSKLSGKDISSC